MLTLLWYLVENTGRENRGQYSVRLFIDGRWQVYTVDDYFAHKPTRKGAKRKAMTPPVSAGPAQPQTLKPRDDVALGSSAMVLDTTVKDTATSRTQHPQATNPPQGGREQYELYVQLLLCM